MAQGGTPKVPRKSTHIDMTAFCDVSFLLLTFFMLATKFKAPDPVEITTPNSVSTKPVPEDNVIAITFDSAGRVFLSMDKLDQKIRLVNYINEQKQLGLDENDVFQLANSPFFAYPLGGVRAFLNGDYGDNLPGIPVGDVGKSENELTIWIGGLIATYESKTKRPDILIKGDMNAKYPNFSYVIESFKKNKLFAFKLVTGQEAVPEGTPLYMERNGLGGGQ